MNRMNQLRSSLLLLTIMLCSHAIAEIADPCVDSDQRFTCINTAISELQTQIDSRLTTLSTEKGLTGPTGATGEQGPQGNQGAVGQDRFTAVAEMILARHQDVEQRTFDMRRRESQEINDQIQTGLIFSLGAVRRQFANVNRNPDIMGNGGDELPFPRDENGNELASFVIFDGPNECTYTSDNGNVVESCVNVGGVDNLPIEDPCLAADSPSYCGNVVTSDVNAQFPDVDLEGVDLSNINVEFDFQDDASSEIFEDCEFVSGNLVCDNNPPIVVSGGGQNAYANYLMGFREGNIVYSLAIQNLVDQLKDDTTRSDIRAALQSARADIPAKYLTLRLRPENNTAEILTALAQAEQEALANVDIAINLVDSFAVSSPGQIWHRLNDGAAKNDLMFLLVIESLNQVYNDYRRCELNIGTANDLLRPCLRLYSPDEIAAFNEFEVGLDVYLRERAQELRNEAIAQKEAFFSNFSGATLASLFGAPETPDFVQLAETVVNDRYLAGQSDDVVAWHQGLAAGGVAAGAVAATAAAAFISTSGLGTIAAASAVTVTTVTASGTVVTSTATLAATNLTFNAIASGASSLSAATAGGAISAVAGPAGIVTAAILIGVLEALELAEQGKKDSKYNALLELDIDSISTDDYDKNALANGIYMLLMIDRPRSVAN